MRRLLLTSTLGILAGCQGAPPGAVEPAFVGSESCAGCHEAEYASWRNSHHALAMQPASADTVLGDFDGAAFEYFGETTRFRSRDGRFFVETGDETGALREYPISEVFGVYPLQQYLVDFPGGRKQALPFAWDARDRSEGGQRWYHLYADEYIGPGDELHWTGHYQNWNYMCAECHSTNLEMKFDIDSNSFDTSWAEISVGCEACHGPGSRHTVQAEADAFDAHFGLAVDLGDARGVAWLPDAGTGIASRSVAPGPLQQPEACGRCHARRGVADPVYRYGRPLSDTHSIALLDEPLYHTDGQILDEVYVYGSFLQSRMYAAGVTCSDCHDPHSAGLRTGAEPNAVCATCHLPAQFAAREHSGHELADAGCVDCHMAARTYMGVDARRDHSFRVPRPDLNAAIGTPLACDNCHDGEERVMAAAGESGARPHFGEIVSAGRTQADNELLIAGAANPDFPSIARATMLTLSQPPFSAADVDGLRKALADADPLVRGGALRAVSRASADTRLAVGAATLADPMRSVRLQAVMAFAAIRDLLPIEEARAFGAAAEEFRATYRALGSSPGVLANLATFEDAMGDPAQANAYLRRAVEASPSNAALRHALGLSDYRVGSAGNALEQLRLAHELDPSQPRYVYVYGVALNSFGQADRAIDVLSRAREDHPGDFDIGWALATILRDTGDLEAAGAAANELARTFPGDAGVAALLQSLERDAETTGR
ncbi:MAG: tetratricopeptide repeat protein [Proteobacteria bacterium]|nr:tetratricopeptide repeat protein [Pseudomonadota bacterium]